MVKVAFFDTKNYDREAFERLNSKEVAFKFFETKLSEDTVELAKGYDGVCVFVNDNVNQNVIDKLYEYGICFIVLRCAGYNNVDVTAAFGKIHVFRVPAYSPYAVAEHAMALLLTSIRRIHKAYIRSRDFNFSLNGLTGFDLHGKTVGVIGAGKIGTVFMNICKGFGMNVLAYDRFPREMDGVRFTDLDELFKESDIISLHCPLTEETKHIIGFDTLPKLKKGVMIINTSRGGLIDAEALLQGIKDRKIGGACLDVYEEEADIFFNDNSGHILGDDVLARLISMPNVIVTSHQAFLTQEALDNIAGTTLQNILDFTENKDNDNEICYRCANIGKCKSSRKSKCF
ncbi:MAG: 2-hydroxyacid dehydrogenase [Eubacterium sp.]|nr:2-hydroxyacid dehydrogenase [Eubacterium sp.]